MSGGSSDAPRKRSVSKKAASSSLKTAKTTPKKTATKRAVTKAAVKKVSNAKKRAITQKTNAAPISSVSATDGATSGVMRELAAELQPRSLAVLSPFRFPVDVHKVMTGTARYGGLAFVVIGALFTLLLFPSIWTTDSMQQAAGTPAQVIDATTETIESTTQVVSEPVANTISVGQLEPLRGVTELVVNTTNASRVELYLFTESWQNRQFLGLAEQVGPDVWRYNWNTTNVVSGLNYRVSAQIWQRSLHTSNPDVTIQTNYMLVDNAAVVEETVDTVVETVNRTPLAQLQVPTRVSGAAEVMVEVPEATSVSVVLDHMPSGSRNILYNATQVRSGVWRVLWPTTNFTNGEYRLSARVRNQYGTYVSGQGTTLVANTMLSNTVTDTVAVDTEVRDDTGEVIEPVVRAISPAEPVTLPTVTLRTLANTTLSGTQQLQARSSGGPVSAMYFYLRDQASLQARFIGVGTKQTETDWSINWYTSNTPNGTYDVFVRAQTPAGSVDSPAVRVSVQNQALLREPQIIIEQRESLITAVREVAEVAPLPMPVAETTIATDAANVTETTTRPDTQVPSRLAVLSSTN